MIDELKKKRSELNEELRHLRTNLMEADEARDAANQHYEEVLDLVMVIKDTVQAYDEIIRSQNNKNPRRA